MNHREQTQCHLQMAGSEIFVQRVANKYPPQLNLSQ
jgi:hypothetical protein